MSPYPRAILLDLDETILASRQGIERSWATVCAMYAPQLGVGPQSLLASLLRPLPVNWNDPVRYPPGRSTVYDLLCEVVPLALADLGLGAKHPLSEAIAQDYIAVFDQEIAPFPGALETLERLKAQGIRLALVTNGWAEPQRRKIKKFKLDALVDAVLSAGELGYGKPEERVFRQALQALGTSPSEAWMAGDSLEEDMAPAQALGITGVWVDSQGTGLPEGSAVRPDRIIRQLAELL